MAVLIRSAHEKMRNKSAFAWIALAVLIVALDAWSKAWASSTLSMTQPVPVTSWLNWVLAHNTGAAFSFLANAGGWQRWFFTILAAAVTVVLLVWLFRLPSHDRLNGLALGLVLGGAVGNLIDRLRLGYVVDFIDVHVAGWHWPAFNIADSAISVGVVLLLTASFLEWKAERRAVQ